MLYKQITYQYKQFLHSNAAVVRTHLTWLVKYKKITYKFQFINPYYITYRHATVFYVIFKNRCPEIVHLQFLQNKILICYF
jgi:hypothetical protein